MRPGSTAGRRVDTPGVPVEDREWEGYGDLVPLSRAAGPSMIV